MDEKIETALMSLVVDIDSLLPLPGNPRKGNVEAIMASYRQFGQVKPIVVRPNGDGTSTVIAGNHQLEAAKRLGWEKIAAIEYGGDEQSAVAFALADNRTVELGHTDPELLQDAMVEIVDLYSDLLDGLGWDEFERAALSEQATRLERSDEIGYVAPVITNPDASFLDASQPQNSKMAVSVDGDGARIVPAGEVDSRSVAATGSTSIGASGSTHAVVQYTLVFDDVDQQKKWYSFVRWLRSDPGYDGATTASRLMNFIDSHANF